MTEWGRAPEALPVKTDPQGHRTVHSWDSPGRGIRGQDLSGKKVLVLGTQQKGSVAGPGGRWMWEVPSVVKVESVGVWPEGQVQLRPLPEISGGPVLQAGEP